jgi:hypothetical protein
MKDVLDAEVQALELQTQLSAIVISDQHTYDKAVVARITGKEWLKDANDWFDSIQKPAYEAYKAILDKRKQVTEPVERRLAEINRGLINWDQEQERARLAEQRRLENEAKAKAEEERIAAAQALEASGATKESVDEFLSAPVAVTEPVVAAPTYEKSSAVVYRDNYSGKVTNLLNLVKFVAKNPHFIGLLQINQTALNQQAKALKDSMNIPGVQVVNNKVVASGRAR